MTDVTVNVTQLASDLRRLGYSQGQIALIVMSITRGTQP